jgi:Restriction endonuclease
VRANLKISTWGDGEHLLREVAASAVKRLDLLAPPSRRWTLGLASLLPALADKGVLIRVLMPDPDYLGEALPYGRHPAWFPEAAESIDDLIRTSVPGLLLRLHRRAEAPFLLAVDDREFLVSWPAIATIQAPILQITQGRATRALTAYISNLFELIFADSAEAVAADDSHRSQAAFTRALEVLERPSAATARRGAQAEAAALALLESLPGFEVMRTSPIKDVGFDFLIWNAEDSTQLRTGNPVPVQVKAYSRRVGSDAIKQIQALAKRLGAQTTLLISATELTRAAQEAVSAAAREAGVAILVLTPAGLAESASPQAVQAYLSKELELLGRRSL